MKKLIITLIIMLFVSNSYNLIAQDKIFGSVGGGFSVPTGDFDLSYKTGYNLAGNIGIAFDKLFGARIDLQYNSFPFKEYTSFYGSVTGNSYTVFTVGADFVVSNFKDIRKPKAFIPYGFAGLYFMYNKPGDTKITTAYSSDTYTYDSESKAALGIGGGAIYNFSGNLGISAEVKYSITLGGEQVNFIPLRVALTFMP